GACLSHLPSQRCTRQCDAPSQQKQAQPGSVRSLSPPLLCLALTFSGVVNGIARIRRRGRQPQSASTRGALVLYRPRFVDYVSLSRPGGLDRAAAANGQAGSRGTVDGESELGL